MCHTIVAAALWKPPVSKKLPLCNSGIEHKVVFLPSTPLTCFSWHELSVVCGDPWVMKNFGCTTEKQKTAAAKKVLSFSCWRQKVTSRQTDATDTTVDEIARYLCFDSVVVWGTRDPTAICATMLISGSMGMYSNAITDNYSLRHVCCLTYEFVHVCKCVCVWLASVVLISHQSSLSKLTDTQTTKNYIDELCPCIHT